MGRIGILTFHNNSNKGAILQAYCLREVVSERYGADAVVVPYRTASKERQRLFRRFVTTRPRRIPWRVRDHRLCERFVQTELTDGAAPLVTDDYDEAVAWLDAQDYDAVVVGSDEVWKVPEERSGLLGTLFPRRPFPNAYVPGENLRARTVAYAASANTLRLEELTERERRHLEASLGSFDRIGVRDGHTERVLDALDVRNVRRTPDPTLLWDIPTKSVEGVLRDGGIDPDEPILGLHGEDDDVFERVAEEFRDRGYQVVSTMGSRFADLRLRGRVDPLQYYSVYRQFDFVVTSSLHSTIFSCKHRTPFATIDTAPVYRHVESKTRSLLADLDLLERHVDATDGDASAFFERIDELRQPLDERQLSRELDDLRERGQEFLDDAMREHALEH